MQCIFCKEPSDNSVSKEHVIPESLGNSKHVLPPGWVCDSCNNYLARKVEAPFLNTSYGRNARFEMSLQNKRGRYTPGTGMHVPSNVQIDLHRIDAANLLMTPKVVSDWKPLATSLAKSNWGELYLPAPTLPEAGFETSRFIAKVGLEVFAHRFVDDARWNKEIATKPELDEIRNYVRKGNTDMVWPISMRRIYPAAMGFTDPLDPCFQMLHEWNILFIESSEQDSSDYKRGEAYAVIAILGVEYVINLGGPELEGYTLWQREHGEGSFLYR